MTQIKRISIAVIIFALIFSSGYHAYNYIKEGKKINNKTYEKLIGNPEELNKKVSVRDEKYFATDIHEMANTLIVAVDGQIRGRIPITEDKCNAMIVEAMASSYEHKEVYLEILRRWKNGDFSQGVKDHNFVWEYLDGTVGRAISLISDKK